MRHTLGLHAGVSGTRYDEMRDQMANFVDKHLDGDSCECDIIRQCVAVGENDAERATIAYATGKAIAYMEQEGAVGTTWEKKSGEVKN